MARDKRRLPAVATSARTSVVFCLLQAHGELHRMPIRDIRWHRVVTAVIPCVRAVHRGATNNWRQSNVALAEQRKRLSDWQFMFMILSIYELRYKDNDGYRKEMMKVDKRALKIILRDESWGIGVAVLMLP